MGPDAVLTTSRKDTSANRLYPSLPLSPSKHPHRAVSPKKTPRKTPSAAPHAALPPVPSASIAPAGSPAAVPSTIPASLAIPSAVPAVASGIPAAQANSSPGSAAVGDGAVVKKKRVAIAAESPVRPGSVSEEVEADSAGLPDAALADGHKALGSGSEVHRQLTHKQTTHSQPEQQQAGQFVSQWRPTSFGRTQMPQQHSSFVWVCDT